MGPSQSPAHAVCTATAAAGGHSYDLRTWQCRCCGRAAPRRDGFVTLAPELAARNDGFEAAAFAGLAAVEAGHFWFEARNQLVQWLVRRYCPAAETFLEIGCGTGFVLAMLARRFPRMKLFGSEIFTTGLTYARQRVPHGALFQMDARDIPFHGTFEVVGAFDVLEHIDDDVRVLRNIADCLVPSGWLLLTVPQHRFLWSAADDYAQHKRRYGRRELVAKLEDSGFEVGYVNSFCTLLLPLMLASRRRRPRLDDDYDPLAELRVGAAMNGILRKVLDVEYLLLRLGVRFPAGGSLVAVARRRAD